MPKPFESTESFLRRQPASALVAWLLEMAEAHEPVRQRLTRLQLADRPDKLAAAFRKTLTAWRRSEAFYDYREARAFAAEVEVWLDQVARELAPKDTPAALDLFERFIEADATRFERADDSDGSIGNAARSACRHWLHAAALCETPPDVWPERLMTLADEDEYGSREELLRHADRLLDKPALTAFVGRYESRLAEVLRSAADKRRPPPEVYKLSAALRLLSDALRDPDVMVRAVLMHSPGPNGQQRKAFARAFLDAGRAADALVWLEDPTEGNDCSRQSLMAEALGQLGRYTESAQIRQRIFEHSLAVFDFQQWLQHLPEPAHEAATSHARRLALAHADPAAAATLLIELDDADGAERRLVDSRASIDGNDYPRLVPLAEALRTHGRSGGETVVYRALLHAILERANSRAYGHAARYWRRLHELGDSDVDLSTMPSHATFTADIKTRHARKVAFWANVSRESDERFGAPDEVDG